MNKTTKTYSIATITIIESTRLEREVGEFIKKHKEAFEYLAKK